jgi:hypothetical protein
MTITVTCPACGEEFATSYRPSINLGLGETWTEQELDDASSATCTRCGHRAPLGTLVIRSG